MKSLDQQETIKDERALYWLIENAPDYVLKYVDRKVEELKEVKNTLSKIDET